MTDRSQSFGGGFLIVVAIAVGTAVGAAFGQSSAGLVAGIAIGSAGATLFWLRDRRRTGR